MTIEARFRVDRGEFLLDVDLSISAEGVSALFGPSGCGKTTLLRAIAGLDRHRNGYLRIGDETWQEADRFVAPHRRRLGYVFQEPSLFGHLNVRSNVEYGAKRVPSSQRKVSVDKAIDLVAIGHLLERSPGTLSGGERQRVAIARALAVSPRLLLMDEPLTALDQAGKQEILPYLESLHDELEIPVIYVSHTREELARLADQLVLLEAGHVVATGTVDEMFTRLDLPLAHGSDADAIVEAVVVGHDEHYNLTYLDSAAGRVSVAGRALQVGDCARLRLAARDVSLTLEHQSGTSILNIFPAVVDELTAEGDAQVTVRLLAGGVPLLARITRKSAAELTLRPGTSVYAQVKSVALLS
ncbi:MAG: molybdenum ABC transporter ATP-binding protein [Gammaproteobacteria bacterium SG8_47]|nr:MAG: molybdenum ABC transporter ATP-binding protein [Gammaproteobacteria bacterium SG8_47]